MSLLRALAIAALLSAPFAAGSGCGGSAGSSPGVYVVSAKDLGALETNPEIRGRDGGYGGVFDGRSVWIYGDTVLRDPAADGRSWRHNSWSYTYDLDSSDGVTGFEEPVDAAGAPVELFPQTDDERAFNDVHFVDPCTVDPCGARLAVWPGPMVVDPGRSRALLFYHLVYAEPGPFNFTFLGCSIATWDDAGQAPVRPVVAPGTAHPTLLFANGEPDFGAAALCVGDTLYAYACRSDDWDKPCILARVPLADALDRSRWRYYVGGGRWSDELSLARPVIEACDIFSVAWNQALGCYLAVYSQTLDTKTMIRTAPAPEGPWSAPVLAFYTIPPTDDGWTYDALAHPELERDGGRVQIVSYSRVIGFLAAEVRLVEVVLARR